MGILGRVSGALVAVTLCGAAGGSFAQVELVSKPPTTGFAALQAGEDAETRPLQAISADGRFTVFVTESRNLAPGDDDDLEDVYLKDLQSGAVTLVSQGIDGKAANAAAQVPAISSDGNTVVFASSASNLVVGDDDGARDVFAFDRVTGLIERVSRNPEGTGNPSSSDLPSVSADGRYVAFRSRRTDLAPGEDENSTQDDVYVFDRQLTLWERANVSTSGEQGNQRAFRFAISRNGRYVAFDSRADNLVDGDENDRDDVFLRDRTMGTTVRVTVDLSGDEFPSPSADDLSVSDTGVVAFSSRQALLSNDTNVSTDVYTASASVGSLSLVSVNSSNESSNGISDEPEISANGLAVVFRSTATDLADGDDEGQDDIFVRDLVGGTTTRVSVSAPMTGGNNDSEGGSINDDGSAVVFSSRASDLVLPDDNFQQDVFLAEVEQMTITRASDAAAPGVPSQTGMGASESPRMSGDGSFVVFTSMLTELDPITGQNPEDQYVFRWSAGTGAFKNLSRANNGSIANEFSDRGDISDDGSRVAFESGATNLAGDDDNQASDVFMYSEDTGLLSLISRNAEGEVVSGGGDGVRLTADGRYAVFETRAELDAADDNNDLDIYRVDLTDGSLTLVSRGDSEQIGDDLSVSADISDDGTLVVFRSRAENLVDDDSNGEEDVFLRDLVANTTTRISVDESGEQVADRSFNPQISGDGSTVSFISFADLVSEDTDGTITAYLYDVGSGALSLVGLNAAMEPANDAVTQAFVSSDGRFVCFGTDATNIVSTPTGGRFNIYLRDLQSNRVRLVSLRVDGTGAQESTGNCQVSDDGKLVLFQSEDGLLVEGDLNGFDDIFLFRDDTLFNNGFELEV